MHANLGRAEGRVTLISFEILAYWYPFLSCSYSPFGNNGY
jgi:hypothetical protein